MMLDSGRARTFQQRSAPDVDQAVASCPVNCMHPVTYRELQEFETARDDGDGRTDHRYLNHQRGHTPYVADVYINSLFFFLRTLHAHLSWHPYSLFVAGIDSDHNRRSSWYHTLKHRCLGMQPIVFFKVNVLLQTFLLTFVFVVVYFLMQKFRQNAHKKDVTTVLNSLIQVTIHISNRITRQPNTFEHCTFQRTAMEIFGVKLQTCEKVKISIP